jgi:hypothetical protein
MIPVAGMPVRSAFARFFAYVVARIVRGTKIAPVWEISINISIHSALNRQQTWHYWRAERLHVTRALIRAYDLHQ